MAISPEILEQFIKDKYGSLLVRDPDSDFGWTPWNVEDSQALCEWLSAGPNGNGNGAIPLLCYKMEEASKVAGVGVHTIQSWVRRKENPLPSFREGRRIVIPHDQLRAWLKEESERSSRA